jgi:hypothetical protein
MQSRDGCQNDGEHHHVWSTLTDEDQQDYWIADANIAKRVLTTLHQLSTQAFLQAGQSDDDVLDGIHPAEYRLAQIDDTQIELLDRHLQTDPIVDVDDFIDHMADVNEHYWPRSIAVDDLEEKRLAIAKGLHDQWASRHDPMQASWIIQDLRDLGDQTA